MRILLTGGTGFIGSSLGQQLATDGHELIVLTRDPKRAAAAPVYPATFMSWDSVAEAAKNIDAVINLVGESVFEKRWSVAQKKLILDSRLEAATRLVNAFVFTSKWPKVWINASAIGWYGDAGNRLLTESEPSGSGFLADVCKQWEAATPHNIAGMRTVMLRTGLVLAPRGGALEAMLPIFRKGMGGPLGDGKQWMSWIHRDDVVAAIVQSLTDSNLAGPVNLVGPEPVTNEEFTKTLADVLAKPARFRVPEMVLKLALGEKAQVVLESQRVLPQKLTIAGFKFKFRDLKSALKNICDFHHDASVSEFYAEQWLAKPLDEVFEFFSAAKNLEKITPPAMQFSIVKHPKGPLERGSLIDYKLKIRGMPARWQTLISDWQPPHKFVDEQLKGPYSVWHHTHEFRAMGKGTLITDRVLYRMPIWPLGEIAGGLVKRDIAKIFAFRKKAVGEEVGGR